MADRHHRSTRPPTRREVLGPADNRANINSTSKRNNGGAKKMTDSSPRDVPHATSLAPSTRSARSTSPAVPSPSPRNGRVSAIVEATQRKEKRNSEISTTSTTASGWRKSYVGRWQLGASVGSGGCSHVRKVRHKDTSEVAAAKIVSRNLAEKVRAQSLIHLTLVPDQARQDAIDSGMAKALLPVGLVREVAIMKLLDHENIVKLYDVWENHNEFYLIMEYVEGGELFTYIDESKRIGEEEVIYIFRQLVAAMTYLHRLSISHRDLKPENILIDRDTSRIKLIDFGMAALMPEGKLLTTACGSPHYAAPEVIRSIPYDGTLADVWSCGVILYVMLTGMTPFNYDPHRGTVNDMYAQIARADYHMPTDLSREAQDLIRRIFVVDPNKRIRMEDIWHHPFMHRFDEQWEYRGISSRPESWIGPEPQLNEWLVTREDEIDGELLNSMQALWHSVPHSVLVKKLLSREANQEKYFYAALVKHRNDNLENYAGSDAMSCAGSDYHHISAGPGRTPAMPMTQSQSQYSILNDEHLRSSESFAEASSSASSYDPYRPSRYRMTQDGENYTKVTVHRRGESNGVRRNHMQHSLRNTHANRVEQLRRGGRQPSTSTLSKNSNYRMSMSRSSLGRTSLSRNSLGSSVWPSSPPVAMPVRAATSHKRGVSFSHIRKSSTASALTAQDTGTPAPYTPELQAKARFAQHPASSSPNPGALQDNALRSRKEGSTHPAHRTKTRDLSGPGQYTKVDVRAASDELLKACDEAFFRTSISSSEYTEKHGPYDTPPSSVVSHREFRTSDKQRALPDLPVETPNTFIARTLEETRSKLAARSAAQNGAFSSAKFEQVMAKLENLMPDAAEADIEAEARRITSAPHAKRADSKAGLPAISEEGRSGNTRHRQDRSEQGHRSATAPVYRNPQHQQPAEPRTVRMVQPSSPMPPRTITKRKPVPEHHLEEPTQDTTFLSVPSANQGVSRESDDSAMDRRSSVGSNTGGDETTSKKKSFWSRLRKDAQPATEQSQQRPRTPQPPAQEQLNDREAQDARANTLVRDRRPQHLNLSQGRTIAPPPHSASSAEAVTPGNDEHKRFGKWLSGKLRGTERRQHDKQNEQTQAENLFSTSPPSPLPPQGAVTGEPVPSGRSLFARFFRSAPEVCTLAFKIERRHAKEEIWRTLNEWRRYGIRDLEYFPQVNSITGRVDKFNSLNLKPVTFRIELFVVMQHGKKTRLSLARCHQVKGAASSFKKVIDALESLCMERRLLVEDEAKRKELCDIVTN